MAPKVGGAALSKDAIYMDQGEWNVSIGLRHARATTFYRGASVARGVPGVRRTQTIATVTTTYAVTKQDSLSLDVPIVNAQFALGSLPTGPVNATRTSGVGDVVLTYRRWLTLVPPFRDSSSGWRRNLALGIGIKLPTGNTDARDRFPDITGATRILRDIDATSQPGDGGVGVLLDAQGFQTVGSSTLFAYAAYLISPRNTNDTVSLFSNLFGAANIPARVRRNSVPDQFTVLVGIARPIPRARGLSGSLGLRVAGIPPSDLIGRSDGFRFAAYRIAIEPGLSYSRGRNTIQASVPIVLHRQVFDTDVVPGQDFASFAPFQVQLQLAHRFGPGPRERRHLAGLGGGSPTPRAPKPAPAQDGDRERSHAPSHQTRPRPLCNPTPCGATRPAGSSFFLLTSPFSKGGMPRPGNAGILPALAGDQAQ